MIRTVSADPAVLRAQFRAGHVEFTDGQRLYVIRLRRLTERSTA